MRKKRFLLGAVALTAALAATGCGGTNGSQAADSAKTQADTGKDSGSQDSGNKDSGVKDTSKADEADRNISCTLTLATWDVAAAKTFEELDMEGRSRSSIQMWKSTSKSSMRNRSISIP
ncbi:hypothetical protein [Enterocloster sp.]|uniref:hypothetical protein n=1 Tax=Enterocloster sp. TaxID=2719315 RepID=UPI0039A333DB